MARRILTKAAERRIELRDQLWPASEERVWTNRFDGFVALPRLMPLFLHLIKMLAERGDPSMVYLDLWCRDWGEGIVAIRDEAECAYSSGYTGTRAVRTWRDHIRQLESLGFLEIAPSGNRDIGQILMVNPFLVAAQLRRDGRVDEAWWTAFLDRSADVGAEVTDPEDLTVATE